MGAAAQAQAARNPASAVSDAKRLIGRKYSAVQKAGGLPFKVVERDRKPYIEIEVGGAAKALGPEEVAAMVLGRPKAALSFGLKLTAMAARLVCKPLRNDRQWQPRPV